MMSLLIMCESCASCKRTVIFVTFFYTNTTKIKCYHTVDCINSHNVAFLLDIARIFYRQGLPVTLAAQSPVLPAHLSASPSLQAAGIPVSAALMSMTTSPIPGAQMPVSIFIFTFGNMTRG